MSQASIVISEFTREFERHAQDAGMAKEDAKVYFVLALNWGTLSHLDTYVTMHGGNEMVHLEIIQYRLCWVPYVQMLAYLK